MSYAAYAHAALPSHLLSFACRFGWESVHAKRVWAWAGDEGDASGPTNVLVDCTTSAQNLPSIKANVINAFRQVCDGGPVAGERLRGVRFDITDAMVHRDSAHRGPSQIVPASCRVLKAAVLAASPALVEPMFRVAAQVPEQYFGAIQSEMASRRGVVDDVQSMAGTPLVRRDRRCYCLLLAMCSRSLCAMLSCATCS